MRTYEIKIISSDNYSCYGTALIQADNFSDAVEIALEDSLFCLPSGELVIIFVTNTSTGVGFKLEAGIQ